MTTESRHLEENPCLIVLWLLLNVYFYAHRLVSASTSSRKFLFVTDSTHSRKPELVKMQSQLAAGCLLPIRAFIAQSLYLRLREHCRRSRESVGARRPRHLLQNRIASSLKNVKLWGADQGGTGSHGVNMIKIHCVKYLRINRNIFLNIF